MLCQLLVVRFRLDLGLCCLILTPDLLGLRVVLLVCVSSWEVLGGVLLAAIGLSIGCASLLVLPVDFALGASGFPLCRCAALVYLGGSPGLFRVLIHRLSLSHCPCYVLTLRAVIPRPLVLHLGVLVGGRVLLIVPIVWPVWRSLGVGWGFLGMTTLMCRFCFHCCCSLQ